MKLLASLFALFRDADDASKIIDRVAVSPKHVSAKDLAEARAEARAEAQIKHGRPFLCDQRKERNTEPSHDLLEIIGKASPKQSNVAAMPKKTKAS